MAVIETSACVRLGNGAALERLVCHPRLPLVAGLDSERPAVHVWDCGANGLQSLGTVGGGSAVYAQDAGILRGDWTPAVAWHPDQPLLLVATEGGVVRWTPQGVSALEGVPPTADYRSLAFSPDGHTLWASPSSGDADEWESSDVLTLTPGTVGTGPPWDTGVEVHPAGGLVVTLCSEQGATLVIFARVDQDSVPARMRVQRRALMLDGDFYQKPIFSSDGRYFAIRGNAHDNLLEVFEFPSLQRAWTATLGEPRPSFLRQQGWWERMRIWSRHNIAFGVRPAVLWIGTPAGTLVEVDPKSQRTVEHPVLAGSPVTGVGVTATGDLVVASGGGDLVLLSVADDAADATAADSDTLQAMVTAFLDATSEVPDYGDLATQLVLTDIEPPWESAAAATA
ncbi:hypothetical protein Rhe02_19830 [Rhizocola hellebori]|uniref:WD40 repeat domain-containing protein n=1 Tax=Rhizocola hellebori TaxID=1392758 RepID=A0A8J3Q557_9ACTN|nr:hypothetical protein [Rhizocola hellebori]GIH03916.1 hypothetical protein Rhe02_19830 [Rhizocola hellebori]